MRFRTENSVFVWLLFACMMLLTDFSAQAQRVRRESSLQSVGAGAVQRDTAARQPANRFEEVARRVDSLQFIIVYNAELLRKDLDTKLIWIYVMLGVMIVATMILYGAFMQYQRQRKTDAEELYNRISTSVTDLDAKFRNLGSGMKMPKAPPKKERQRRKRGT